MAGKKLVGIYLPTELIAKLKKFIMQHYMNTGEERTQFEVVEEALVKYISDHDKPSKKKTQ